MFHLKCKARNSRKKETTGGKKSILGPKKDIVNWKKEGAPIFNSDSSASEFKLSHIYRDYIFKEEQDTIKHVTVETPNWMAICIKMIDDKIDPFTKEHRYITCYKIIYQIC